MKKVVKQSTILVFITIISIILLIGCVSIIRTTKTANLHRNAKILIMPPRDVVQGGIPHPAGAGTGRQLQKSVQRELNKSSFDVIIFEPNQNLNHTEIIYKKDAMAESKKIGADYVLILTLGEFLNAAPMTFRKDFVTLENGVLIDVNTKKEVWSLNRPFIVDTHNLRDHYALIDKIAKAAVESIIK